MARSLTLPSSTAGVTSWPDSSVPWCLSKAQLYLNIKRSRRNSGDDRCISDPAGFVWVVRVEQTGMTTSCEETEREEKGKRQGILQMPVAALGQPNPRRNRPERFGKKKPNPF